MFSIYVASLSDYNNGILHGVWINNMETKSKDKVWEEVQEMLAASPAAKKYGEVSEEWAIHDYDGYPSSSGLGETENFQMLCDRAAALEEYGEAFAAYWEYADKTTSVDDAARAFEDAFQGIYESERVFAESFIEDLGILDQIPTHLQCYSDFDAYSRDLFLDGYWSAYLPDGKGLAVFSSY